MVHRLILLFLALGFIGCGGGITRDTRQNYDDLINLGWDRYNQSMYDDAYQLFLTAKEVKDDRPEAYIGCGWTLFRRQHPDSAVVLFLQGFTYIESLDDSVDALSGLSGSYLARGENIKITNLFKDKIVSSYENVFPLKKHDFFLEEGHLEIVQAMAFYRMGYYTDTDNPLAENPETDNALYHLNQALSVPYVYTDPAGLMQKMTEYLEQSKGDYY